MAMLAEPKRKQKWTLNPRGKQWSDDSSKFGQKMLEKMGWSSGKGLGLNEQGMTEHLRVKLKDDNSGLGYSKSHQDKLWTKHQESFNDLLQQLASADDESIKPVEIAADLSGKSLEVKSKHSRARVHYKKFTRGKDVNKYSEKDLANIFGKKDLHEKEKEEEIVEEIEDINSPIGSSEMQGGVLTIKGGTMSDYFKNKKLDPSEINRKADCSSNESDSERYVGFGFNSVEKSDNFAYTNPGLDLNYNETIRKRKLEILDSPTVELGSKKSKKRKVESFAFENPGLDLVSPENNTKVLNPMEVPRIPEFIPVECIPQTIENDVNLVDSTKKDKTKKKKKKSHKDISNGFVNDALNLETMDDNDEKTNKSKSPFEIKRTDVDGLANSALDLTDETSGKKRVTFNDVIEFNVDSKKKLTKLDKFEVENDIKPKKKKKKSKKDTDVNETNVFVNEALDIDDNCNREEVIDNEINEKKNKKHKRKRDRRISNLETIEEIEEDKESNKTNVITSNDTLKVKKIKEDEEEEEKDIIHQEITTLKSDKKKKKKNKQVETEVLDATGDISASSSSLGEVDTSELSKKSKKKKHEMIDSNLTSTVDESNDVKKKKKKDKNIEMDGDKDVKNENFNKENSSKTLSDNKLEENIEEDINLKSPWNKISNPRKKLKYFFTQSPILNFVGSNINEIQGYGV